MKTAEANNSTFIIANDPDADRLAIAEKLKKYSQNILLSSINSFSFEKRILSENWIGELFFVDV